MKTKTLLIAATLFLTISAMAQNSSIELSFTSVDNTTWIPSDSVKIINRALGCDTVLHWPDTVLSIIYSGTPRINTTAGSFRVFRNYPNPSAGLTTLSLYVPETDRVSMFLSDLTGRVLLRSNRLLESGVHSFYLNHGGEPVYFFTAEWRGIRSSVKILEMPINTNRVWSLEYLGAELISPQIKTTKANAGFLCLPGDPLLFIGYANGLQSGIPDSLEDSKSYSLQFATNIPCPGIPTIEYEGQVYNTIQIFSQCWLKENLNAGVMINGTENQTDNSTLEKYCLNNHPDSCAKYGGLYQWDEMMQYTTQQHTQGICPPGWHLTADEDWKVLEGAVDSQYGIGNNIWDTEMIRGFDAGKNLKTTSGWIGTGNGTDLFGFSAQPGCYRLLDGGFEGMGREGVFWTSTPTVTDYAWYRNFWFYNPKVGRWNDSYSFKEYGFSVRCLKDY
jgi:uncharacterized protein (TIGR02145 family)